MHIAIHAPGMPFNGATIPDGESLGGSESGAYYMARELVQLGHKVVVFTTSRKTGKWDGVTYEWMGLTSETAPLGLPFHLVMQAPYDVVIVQRHPFGFIRPVNSKLNIWWLHDLALHRNAGQVQQHLVHVDRIFTVSEFHRRQVSAVYGVDQGFICPTLNGVDYGAFEGLEGVARKPRSLIFAARPERGLEQLVGPDGIMERLPDCHLDVCGYDNTTDQMRGYYEYLWSRCDALPNVTRLGALGKRELYERMAASMLYVYPTTFEDTSCIAAIEANAAGTPFVAFRTAALPETIGKDGAKLLPLKKGQVDIDRFVRNVGHLLDTEHNNQWNTLHHKALQKRQSWGAIAREWSDRFEEWLAVKSADTVRLYRHFERMSDIMVMARDKAPDELDAILPGFKKNYAFLINDDFKGHYERVYQYEKERGVIYGPEDLAGNGRFEAIADIIGQLKPGTVLDYGCAHGHYVMNLLRRFADMHIVGVDINASNIATAKKWAEDDHQAGRAQFLVGAETDIEGTFDLILAAEVIEHVPGPAATMNRLMAHLNPGGSIVISTPYGPWEAIGYRQHPGWRAHIHHFERQDLFELFGNQTNYRLMAVPHRGNLGNLGNFILTFQPSGDPAGAIDYERKRHRQAPRETLSACLIVKDAEYTLGKTLKGLAGIADEIIVGVDATTTDRTRAVAEAFGARTFEMASPIEQGFDAARNDTIRRATMDWILWIDDDETLEQAENLPQYLRPNCYHGYAVKQHHYAVEPAMLYRTDLPVRLFRNRRGVRFFGIVHEHPSQGDDPNKGVGKVILLPDVAIMHTGYSTEAIRRRRFDRNFPLMRRDREAYPQRILGKFLWCRDLAHAIRHILEANGNRMTPEIHGYAEEVITLWRDLLEHNELRMVTEALRYYSEAVNVLGEGIPYAVNLDTSANGRGPELSADPIKGVFAGPDDIEVFTDRLVKSRTQIFKEKYF